MNHYQLFLVLLSMLLLSACIQRDPCDTAFCPLEARCDDGECLCPTNTVYDEFSNTCDCATGFERDFSTGECVVIVADPCENIICNNGTCNNGLCDCDTGYEQDSIGRCTVEERTKFVAAYYQAQENCPNGFNSTYTCDIQNNGTDPDAIRVVNLNDSRYAVFAIVDGTQFDIPNQTSLGDNIRGTGRMDNNGVITIDYTITYSFGSSVSCTATLTR